MRCNLVGWRSQKSDRRPCWTLAAEKHVMQNALDQAGDWSEIVLISYRYNSNNDHGADWQQSTQTRLLFWQTIPSDAVETITRNYRRWGDEDNVTVRSVPTEEKVANCRTTWGKEPWKTGRGTSRTNSETKWIFTKDDSTLELMRQWNKLYSLLKCKNSLCVFCNWLQL